jgi:hypothetical protein
MIPVKLTTNEMNLILSSLGLTLNIVQDEQARSELEALQAKFVMIRDANAPQAR